MGWRDWQGVVRPGRKFREAQDQGVRPKGKGVPNGGKSRGAGYQWLDQVEMTLCFGGGKAFTVTQEQGQ